MMISLSNINAEDWSHPTSEYGTTAYSSVTEIWSDGPVFKIGVDTLIFSGLFGSSGNSHQKINLLYKDVIQDKSYKSAGNNAVTWKSVPTALHSSGEAICDVANNEIVVGYRCVDNDCGMVELGCLAFVEGQVGNTISTKQLQNAAATELACDDYQYMVGLECAGSNCVTKTLKCAEIFDNPANGGTPPAGSAPVKPRGMGGKFIRLDSISQVVLSHSCHSQAIFQYPTLIMIRSPFRCFQWSIFQLSW